MLSACCGRGSETFRFLLPIGYWKGNVSLLSAHWHLEARRFASTHTIMECTTHLKTDRKDEVSTIEPLGTVSAETSAIRTVECVATVSSSSIKYFLFQEGSKGLFIFEK